MKTLCIDTSSDVCSICVMQGDEVLAIKELNNGKTHSENLMPLIKAVVDNLNTIEVIACCVGPGSFTGIRIGLSAVKAIAEVKQIPIIGVSSLESLSYNQEFDGDVCAMIDARNNQVYAALFNKHKLIGDYMAEDINEVLASIKSSNNILFIGNGAILHKEKIAQQFGDKALFTDKNEQTAVSIGKCANNKNKYDTADSILPLYLRKSQAERLKEEESLKKH